MMSDTTKTTAAAADTACHDAVVLLLLVCPACTTSVGGTGSVGVGVVGARLGK
jgi:hypothetical protein